MGYPDIQQIAYTLGQEASDAMEGMIAMNYVEWNNETIKTAEKAAKEADQIVMIKTTDILPAVFVIPGSIYFISIPDTGSRPAQVKITLIAIWMFIYQSSLWFTIWFSIFCYLKITSFTHFLFLWLSIHSRPRYDGKRFLNYPLSVG
ncbi:unnamed protein product [Caretta caretta]